jgi:thiol-disulfide isomerase/thioredoxin
MKHTPVLLPHTVFIVLSFIVTTITMNSYAVEAEEKAPIVELQRLEGETAANIISINDYKGKLIYLDFWASWCGPCRQSFPFLQDIRTRYANQGFEVIAVNVDAQLSDALRFLKQFPVDYPVLLDPKYTMAQTYAVQGLPTAYLIDTEGNVIYKHLGFKEADKQWITALIEQQLPPLKKQP